MAEGLGPASVSPSLPHSVSNPNTTESPTSPATSGTAGYIIAAIIVSQVITAREHPPRLLRRQEGEGEGEGRERSRKSRNEQRKRARERGWRRGGRKGGDGQI